MRGHVILVGDIMLYFVGARCITSGVEAQAADMVNKAPAPPRWLRASMALYALGIILIMPQNSTGATEF